MKELPLCSLPATQLPERLARWKALTARALMKSSEPGIVRSTYPRTQAISRELTDLIAAENQCCSFLVFNVREDGDQIEVEVRYPEEFKGAIGALT